MTSKESQWKQKYLDQAEAINRTPYSLFIRAESLWYKVSEEFAWPGPVLEKALADLYETLDCGAQLEPDNLLWPFMTAVVKAAEAKAAGEPRNAAMACLSLLSGKNKNYVLPEPEGIRRRFLLESENLSISTVDSLHLNVDLCRILAASAAHQATQGKPGALQGLSNVSKSMARYVLDGNKSKCRENSMYVMFAASFARRIALAMDKAPEYVHFQEGAEYKARALTLRALADEDGMPAWNRCKGFLSLSVFFILFSISLCFICFLHLFAFAMAGFFLIFKRYRNRKAGLVYLLRQLTPIFSKAGKKLDKASKLEGPWQWPLVRRPLWTFLFKPFGFLILVLVIALGAIMLYMSLDPPHFWQYDVSWETAASLILSPQTAFERHQEQVWADFDARYAALGRTLVTAGDPGRIRDAADAAGLVLPSDFKDSHKENFEKVWQSEKAFQSQE